MKRASAALLELPPPPALIDADSPVPFNIRQLWFELDDYERRTLADRATNTPAGLVTAGSADALTSNIYPPPAPGTSPPFAGPRRGVSRNLELLRGRIRDPQFRFVLDPGPEFIPDATGRVQIDVDAIVSSWIGHDRPITVLDMSGLPSEAMSLVVGTVLRLVYDTLYWAGTSAVSGRSQPLLIVLDEAHAFLPAKGESPALRAATRIAREGRKYGVGLMVVTQRPSDIDLTILTQCGTVIALRTTGGADRAAVTATLPDELGGLTSMLPSLRTGEALVVGESIPIPTRIRVRSLGTSRGGGDPDVAKAWRSPRVSDAPAYRRALINWRKQSHA